MMALYLVRMIVFSKGPDDWSLDKTSQGVVDEAAHGANVEVNESTVLGGPSGSDDASLDGIALGSDDNNTFGILLGTDDG